ncbi:MAG: hypothetical protein KY443_05540 [Actinobacteria bacterium]|nr:hypothetical protein [Actinomycetota bacterium]
MTPGAVVVFGLDAEAVAARVAELREARRRAAGYVGDDRVAAEVMAAELFGGDFEVEPLR